MSAPTTTAATRAGVVSHGLHALANHIEARGLPAPRRIAIALGELVLTVFASDGERWAVTLADGTGVRCIDVHSGRAFFETTGLLPDTGVRIRIRWAARTTLTAVAR